MLRLLASGVVRAGAVSGFSTAVGAGDGRWAAVGIVIVLVAGICDGWLSQRAWDRRFVATECPHRQLTIVNAGAVATNGATMTVIGPVIGNYRCRGSGSRP